MALKDTIERFLNYILKRKKEEKPYEKTTRKFDLSKILSDDDLSNAFRMSGFGVESFSFDKLFDLQVGRVERYRDYEQIYYRIPEASQGIHIYVDEIIAPNIGNMNNRLRIESEGGRLGDKAQQIAEMFVYKTGLIDILPNIIFNTILFGDCFVETKLTDGMPRYILHDHYKSSLLYDGVTDIELGLIVALSDTKSPLREILKELFPEMKYDAPRKNVVVANMFGGENQERIVDFDKLKGNIQSILDELTKKFEAKFLYIPPDKYTHFKIMYNNLYYPYGTSVLESARAIAKQLLLTEAALAIHRVTRAPHRKQFSIECSNVPETDIPSFIEGVKDRIKKSKILQMDGGLTIDSIPDMLSTDEDYWVPSIDGAPLLTIDHIAGDDSQSKIDDIEYFKRKMLGAIGIPPAYLASEEGTSTRALLTLEDIRFSRTIKKLQGDINVGLNSLLDNCFVLIDKKELQGFSKITLPEPQNFEDSIRLENIGNRLNVASDITGQFPGIPKLWILKKIVGITDEEIEEMKSLMQEEDELPFKLRDESEEGGYDDFGGSSDFDTGLGTEDFGEEFGGDEGMEDFGEPGGEEEFDLGEEEEL